MKRLLTVVPVLLITLSSFAAAEVVTGTYDIDTVDGSSTTIGGSFLDAYNLTSTGFSTFSLLTFTPTAGQDFTFSGITNLSLTYDAIAGGIAGGAPRIEVDFTNGDSLLALLGPAGSFVDPTLGPGNSGNLVALDDTGRYDLSQGGLGGSSYTNYDAALAAAGGMQVSGFDIILDGGWATSDNFQQFDLNGNPLTVDATVTAATPEPATFGLFGFGLVALGFAARKRRSKH